MIARGMDGRAAAEAVTMPAALRDGWEFYGQVESHVRQIYGGTVGWFGNDVYDINPLPIAEEARRTVALMGGPTKVRSLAAEAAAAGDIAGWQWALRLTSLLLQLDAEDAEARRSRAIAARARAGEALSTTVRPAPMAILAARAEIPTGISSWMISASAASIADRARPTSSAERRPAAPGAIIDV
jgi:alkyl sulfatase BDS1-like metallo-beta-lactamase superfamily hydrolase